MWNKDNNKNSQRQLCGKTSLFIFCFVNLLHQAMIFRNKNPLDKHLLMRFFNNFSSFFIAMMILRLLSFLLLSLFSFVWCFADCVKTSVKWFCFYLISCKLDFPLWRLLSHSRLSSYRLVKQSDDFAVDFLWRVEQTTWNRHFFTRQRKWNFSLEFLCKWWNSSIDILSKIVRRFDHATLRASFYYAQVSGEFILTPNWNRFWYVQSLRRPVLDVRKINVVEFFMFLISF